MRAAFGFGFRATTSIVVLCIKQPIHNGKWRIHSLRTITYYAARLWCVLQHNPVVCAKTPRMPPRPTGDAPPRPKTQYTAPTAKKMGQDQGALILTWGQAGVINIDKPLQYVTAWGRHGHAGALPHTSLPTQP
mmetsp:Transcript_9731/g.13880  ORF Transcript_9731/g.13880 Transcript_9731/m.13880 type:complete len:133 (-) Transcript_9731:1143-1541(-)|eukprot:scaffold304540_cov40-Tisochrysis_lutea.AAC.1